MAVFRSSSPSLLSYIEHGTTREIIILNAHLDLDYRSTKYPNMQTINEPDTKVLNMQTINEAAIKVLKNEMLLRKRP